MWTATLDNRYEVTVSRAEPYHALLTITNRDQIIHRQNVGLMYNALFGPDVDDIDLWQQIATDFIDGRNSGQSTL